MRTLLVLSTLAAGAAACTIPDKVLVDGGEPDGGEPDGGDAGGDAPDTRITAAPPASDNSTTVSFAFASEPAGATFECALDAAAFAACTTPREYADLADGEHTFRVRAVDAAGNRDETPASHTWTIDASTPDTRIDGGPSGAVASAAATFMFSSPDAGAGARFECQLDGSAFADCGSPYMVPAQADGSHTFAVRVRDASGNVDPTPATRTWMIDTVLPDTTIDGGPTGLVASTGASFTLTSAEAGVAFECDLDGGGFAACPATYLLGGLGQGAHTLRARAIDLAGNRDASPAQRAWTVDTVAPETTIASGPPMVTGNPSISFDFTSEAGATFQCNRDGAGFTACADPYAFTATDGGHTLEVRAVDAAGNLDPSPASRSWTVDTVVPDTTIVSGPPAVTTSNTASFDFAASEAGVLYQCRLGTSGTFAACADPHQVTVGGNGSYTLQVRAIDAAGNVDASPASRSWTVDGTAPVVTIQAPTGGSSTGPYVRVDFTVNETGTTTTCRVGAAAFQPCTSGSFINAGAGSRTLEVRAVDAAGNAGTATVTWTVTCTLPPTLPQAVAQFRYEDAADSQSVVNSVNAAQPALRGMNDSVEPRDPARVAAGRWGAGLRFTRAEQDVVWWLVTGGTPITMATWTIEAWVRPSAVDGYVWRQGGGHLEVRNITTNGETAFHYYMFPPGGGGGSVVAAPVAANAWHHVVATYDGTRMTLYVDGVAASSTSVPQDITLEMGHFFMGNANYFEAVGLEGDLDEVSIGRQVLTEAEARGRYCPAP